MCECVCGMRTRFACCACVACAAALVVGPESLHECMPCMLRIRLPFSRTSRRRRRAAGEVEDKLYIELEGRAGRSM